MSFFSEESVVTTAAELLHMSRENNKQIRNASEITFVFQEGQRQHMEK
jgi:hypothetical protein